MKRHHFEPTAARVLSKSVCWITLVVNICADNIKILLNFPTRLGLCPSSSPPPGSAPGEHRSTGGSSRTDCRLLVLVLLLQLSRHVDEQDDRLFAFGQRPRRCLGQSCTARERRVTRDKQGTRAPRRGQRLSTWMVSCPPIFFLKLMTFMHV